MQRGAALDAAAVAGGDACVIAAACPPRTSLPPRQFLRRVWWGVRRRGALASDAGHRRRVRGWPGCPVVGGGRGAAAVGKGTASAPFAAAAVGVLSAMCTSGVPLPLPRQSCVSSPRRRRRCYRHYRATARALGRCEWAHGCGSGAPGHGRLVLQASARMRGDEVEVPAAFLEWGGASRHQSRRPPKRAPRWQQLFFSWWAREEARRWRWRLRWRTVVRLSTAAAGVVRRRA